MEQSLYELGEMDALASRTSPVHALHPLAKLLVTLAYLVCVVSFSKYDLSGLAPMVLFPLVLFQLSGIPVRTCFRKLRFVLPLVMAVGLFNPLFDRAPALMLGTLPVSGGVLSMLTLMCKGVFCLMSAFLLMATTRIDALCAALRKLRLPDLLVTLLLLTFRYVGVLTREAAIMSEAYHLRAPGQKGIHYSAWGSFLGQLLLRSMDRAEELYGSMQLRGFHGEFHYADPPRFRWQDGLYTLCCLGACFLLRRFHLAQLLGSLFVR